MKVLIFGSREFAGLQRDFAKDAVRLFIGNVPEEAIIISGGAAGVDSWAIQYAKARGLQVVIRRPDYTTFPTRAPLIRDKQMVDEADRCYGFWNGHSRGTSFTMGYAERRQKLVTVWTFT